MNEYYDTQILADISWTSLSSEVNNLPLIYTKLENYILSKFEGWQLSHRCTCILHLQIRLYEVTRWWSERSFPLVAQSRNSLLTSEAYQLGCLVPPIQQMDTPYVRFMQGSDDWTRPQIRSSWCPVTGLRTFTEHKSPHVHSHWFTRYCASYDPEVGGISFSFPPLLIPIPFWLLLQFSFYPYHFVWIAL